MIFIGQQKMEGIKKRLGKIGHLVQRLAPRGKRFFPRVIWLLPGGGTESVLVLIFSAHEILAFSN